MRIAVTGASGFVGRHVLQALAGQDGVDVLAVSRSAPGEWLPKPFEHLMLDLAAPLPDAFERMGRPDVVVHLAWSGLPRYRSLHHFDPHLSEQFRFLRSLVEAGLPSLLCVGTCFEYGMQSGELDEGLATEPCNPYGHAKDALRRQLEFLAQEKEFALTWARLFYMYGEGQPSSSLYAQFMAAISNGESVFPMSGGEQLRDYLHVTEVAQRLASLAFHAPGAGIVNVCSGRPISVRALVEGWRDALGSSIRLQLGHYSYPTHEPMAFWGRDAKLKRLLKESA
jgi:nucleoside-diphosphate-sugar epimerase